MIKSLEMWVERQPRICAGRMRFIPGVIEVTYTGKNPNDICVKYESDEPSVHDRIIATYWKHTTPWWHRPGSHGRQWSDLYKKS